MTPGRGHTHQTVSLSVSLEHRLFTIYLGCVVPARSLLPMTWEACTAAGSFLAAMLEHIRVLVHTVCDIAGRRAGVCADKLLIVSLVWRLVHLVLAAQL